MGRKSKYMYYVLLSLRNGIYDALRFKDFQKFKNKGLSFNVILLYIMKTCPCNVYPLEPQFYIAKPGYAGVYLFFLFLLQNIDCGYSLEPPRRGGSNVYPQSMF